MKTSTIVGFLTAFYFGFILSRLFGVGVSNWELWVVIIPVIIGFGIEKEIYKKGN